MPTKSVAPTKMFTEGTGALKIHLDESCGAGLRSALTDATSLFVESDPASADIVIFGSDDIPYLNQSALLRSCRRKSICITESDIPTFRLPGLYAANMKSVLTSSRARTISYFISERERGNPEIRRLIGHTVEKRYLYSFMGGSNSWPRKRLFGLGRSPDDTLIEPTDAYNHWAVDPNDTERRADQMRRYARVMAESKFSLCPRGCGLSSYRLFESMSLGVAPVIISDKWRPIEGIDWSFALFVPERRIPDIDRIVRSHEQEWAQRGQAARAIYEELLSRDAVAETLHDNIIEIIHGYSRTREAVMGRATVIRAFIRNLYWIGYRFVKHAILWSYHLSGRPFPIRLNRPLEIQLNRGVPARRNAAR